MVSSKSRSEREGRWDTGLGLPGRGCPPFSGSLSSLLESTSGWAHSRHLGLFMTSGKKKVHGCGLGSGTVDPPLPSHACFWVSKWASLTKWRQILVSPGLVGISPLSVCLSVYSRWLWNELTWSWVSLVAQMVKKNHLQHGRPGFDPWIGKISWRRAWQPTPVFLPRESPGLWRLAGYSSWGYKESDITGWLSTVQTWNWEVMKHLKRNWDIYLYLWYPWAVAKSKVWKKCPFCHFSF